MKKITKKALESNIIKDNNTQCWEWQGALTKRGYGKIKEGIKTFAVHRVAYTLYIGVIPKDFNICHKCDNPKCINPDHLFAGTQADNMKDKVKKGRHKVISIPNNNHAAKKVQAGGKIYESYTAAGKALGISDNGIRKRIKLNWKGYKKLH
jgi:hypothetical protein